MSVSNDTARLRAALEAVEEIVAFGGNGEGWYITDVALIARAALGKPLVPSDVRRVRQIVGDDIADNAPEVVEGTPYA
jgi:hypothetical protein